MNLRRCLTSALALATTARLCIAAGLISQEELGLRVAPGFRVTLYSDSDLANDIYAMTLDSQ